jgi:predicted nucleotide-binding protein
MTSMAVLRIALPQAREQLTERVELGRRVLQSTDFFYTLGHPVSEQLEGLWQSATRWHDYNCTWLLNNIGEEVRAEYQAVAGSVYRTTAGKRNFLEKDILKEILPLEISKLESIRERLPLWMTVPEPIPQSDHTIREVDEPDKQELAHPDLRPGRSTAPVIPVSAPNRKAVMVIYGHDKEANSALFDWLRSIGLQPREWDQLVHATGNASPYVGDVLDQAFEDAQAVIAFFTPDERVRPRGHSGPWRLQARPNVLIEAGMALVAHPKRTILAVLGPQELPSDLAGRHYVRLNHTAPEPLHALATRLRDAGCDLDLNGTDWLNPARFPDRDNVAQYPTDPARPPPLTSEPRWGPAGDAEAG